MAMGNGAPVPPRPFKISADEVNCLIHAYLRDAGLDHAAFALRAEAKLEQSENFRKYVPHGELVDFLSKALLYNYIDVHGISEKKCTAQMSLLEKHECTEGQEEELNRLSSEAIPPNPILRQSYADTTVKSSTNAEGGPSSVTSRNSAVAPTPTARTGMNADTMDVDKGPEPSPSAGQILETEIPSTVRLLSGTGSEVFSVCWNAKDPSLLATGGPDAALTIWKLPNPKEPQPHDIQPRARMQLTTAPDSDVTALDWHPDGKTLAVGSFDAKLRIVNSDGELQLTDTAHRSPIFGACWSPNGRWLVTASLDKQSCLWDMSERRMIRKAAFQECCLDCIWITNKVYAIAGGDSRVTVMSVDCVVPIACFYGHEHEVNQLRVNESRTFLASGSDDHTARIWNISHVQALIEARNRGGEDEPVVLSPEQNTPFIGEYVVLRGHAASVNSIDWSGTRAGPEVVATASFDQESRLWDPRTGACLAVFKDHTKPLFNLAFSKSGLWLLTGAGDGFLHIYDVKDRKKVWSWRIEGKPARAVFDLGVQAVMDTERLAAGLESGRVAIIDLKQLRALKSRQW